VQDQAEQILRGCRFFAQIDSERLNRLATLARVRKFRKGQVIFRQGEPCPGVYVVHTGTVRVYKIGPSGKEHILHMVGAGNTFAEVAAVGGFDCPAHAEAIESTTCALIPLDDFRRAMGEDHELCLQMMYGLSFWVRHLLSLLEDLVLRDAIGRLARFLLESDPCEPDSVRLPGLKRHVASHLNLTSETLSRTLSRLIEAGLITELDGNRVRIEDRGRLEAIAEGLFPQI
jgi:CRP/FNR family transcriptional regulator